jgi:hypothetical protein
MDMMALHPTWSLLLSLLFERPLHLGVRQYSTPPKEKVNVTVLLFSWDDGITAFN